MFKYVVQIFYCTITTREYHMLGIYSSTLHPIPFPGNFQLRMLMKEICFSFILIMTWSLFQKPRSLKKLSSQIFHRNKMKFFYFAHIFFLVSRSRHFRLGSSFDLIFFCRLQIAQRRSVLFAASGTKLFVARKREISPERR